MDPNNSVFFVISAIEPYVTDIIRCMTLPKGLNDRVRYRYHWIQDELIGNQKNLVGKKALLLLRDAINFSVYPIRFVEIVSVETISNVMHFAIELEELVQYDEKFAVSTNELKKFNDEIKLHHYDKLFNEDISKNKYVFKSSIRLDNFMGEHAEEVHIWGNVITLISAIENLKGKEFLKVIDVQTLNKKSVDIKNGLYQLSKKTYYKVILFQLVPNPKVDPPQPHEIEIKSPIDHIKILKARQNAVGKYDIISFVIQTNDLRESQTSYIEIISQGLNNSVPFSINLPINIEVKLTFISVLRIVIGALSLITIILYPLISDPHKILINNIAIVLFILSVSDKLDWKTQLIARSKLN